MSRPSSARQLFNPLPEKRRRTEEENRISLARALKDCVPDAVLFTALPASLFDSELNSEINEESGVLLPKTLI